MSPRAEGSNPAALTSAASSVTTENHSGSGSTPTSAPEQTSSACTKPVPKRDRSSLSVTHGKNGVPELPAQPDPLAGGVRVPPEARQLLAGSPLSVTHGKNGVPPLPAQPGWRGCESYPVTSEDRSQEDAVSEIWEECDACQSDDHGHSLTGRLCARHRQQRLHEIDTGVRAGADLREGQRLILDALQAHNVLTPAESEEVRERMRVFAAFIDEATGSLSDVQGRAFLMILRDFAACLVELTGGKL